MGFWHKAASAQRPRAAGCCGRKTQFCVRELLTTTLSGETNRSRKFSAFAEESLKHCNMQLWLPGRDREENLYKGRPRHGMALTGIPITANGSAAMRMLEAEISRDEHFMKLSAVEYGHWPILVLRADIIGSLSPHLWQPLLSDARSATSKTA